MKFSMADDRLLTRITASPGEFDGTPPVPTLEFGLSLQSTSTRDRVAVGLALIYSPWLAGPMETPEPISALTAQLITDFFGERYVTVGTVTDRALPIPRGTLELPVVDLTNEQSQPQGAPQLCLAPLGLREGSTSFGNHHTVASNVDLFAAQTSLVGCAHLHTLGLAVILAEYCDANVLVHPAAEADVPGLGLLLESVGLGLSAT